MSSGPRNRIPFLDGVRGYASLWVMLGHFSTRTGFWVPILESPGIAVDVFMILSGFLMTQHFFLREKCEPWEVGRTWLAFYVRRFFRVAPLYYALLIPSFLAFNFLAEAQQQSLKTLLNISYQPTANTGAVNVLMHVSFLFGLMPKYSSVLAIPDWSLSLEMQFYAVFPFLMLLARRWNIFRLSLVILPVWFFARYFRSSAGHWGSVGQMFSLQSFLPLKIGLFLIGMIMAWTWMENKGRLTPKGTILLLLLSFIAACARDKDDGGLTGTIILVVSLLLILLLFRDPSLISLGIERWASMVENFLSNRLSRFLADVSYAVYLVHILLMIPLLRFLCSFPWFVHQRSGFRFLILTSVAGPATYGVAWMLFRIVETRGIQLGKMWVEKLATDRTLETSDRSLTTTRGGAQ